MFRKIFVPKKTINFLSLSKPAAIFSTLLLIASFYMWFTKGNDKYGIDYKGGYEIVVSFETPVNAQSVRSSIEKIGIKDAIVQSFSGADEFLIRLSDDKKNPEEVKKELRDTFNNNIPELSQKKDAFQILKVDFVGPTAGGELRKQAFMAVMISVIGILIYISIRFEFAFALGAVVALFHDVTIGLGLYLMCGQTISVTTLAAALTLLGYSVNDTIVIFDRIREDLIAAKKYVLEDVINEAITQTLSRTIITSILTLFSAIALLVFGGGEIKDLSLFLVIGLVIGCYSTIFIASPIALWWADRHSNSSK